MYHIHFLYCVSNTLDADCHTWNRNGGSDCPFAYSGVNQKSESWIDKFLMFGAWLSKEASNAKIGIDCAFVGSEWSLSLPVESLGMKSNAQGHSYFSPPEGARVGSAGHYTSWCNATCCRGLLLLSHWSYRSCLLLTDLLSLQVEMDLVSALSVDRLYTTSVKEKWMTLSITNSHSLNSRVLLLT